MTPTDGSTDDLRDGDVVGAGRTVDPDAAARLVEQLHQRIATTVEDWAAGVAAPPEPSEPRSQQSPPPAFARPLPASPVRMEQLARTPEPTADLDDLVDVLVPRLLERLVPELRDALKADR